MSEGLLHIYTRVSSDQQEDNTSLEQQKKKGISLSERLGYVPKVWNEGVGSSSKDTLDNRPVIVELLSKVRDGYVKHLYVEYTDRLSRNQKTWSTIRFLLEQHNVLLYTGSDTSPIDITDPQDNLILGIMSEISQFDNKVRTQRLHTGKFNRIKEGRWQGGPTPFGYQNTDGYLRENPDESVWVVKIFEWYRDYKSIDKIRDLLLENTVRTRRGNIQWSHGSIQKLLSNTHYSGWYQVINHKTNERHRIDCPRIVNVNLYEEVRTMIEQRSYGQRLKQPNQKKFHLCTDLIFCSCGEKMRRMMNGKKWEYRCVSKMKNYKLPDHQKIVCYNKNGLNGDVVDEYVWNNVVDILSKSNLFKDIIKTDVMDTRSKKKSDTDIKNLKTQIRKSESEILKINHVIGNLSSVQVMGEGDENIDLTIDSLTQKRDELRSKLVDLSKELSDTETNSKWVSWVKEFGRRIDEISKMSDPVEQNDFLKGVINRIDVSFNEDTEKHQILNIRFILPFVDDDLEWKDPSKKSKGYRLIDGKWTESIDVSSSLKKV